MAASRNSFDKREAKPCWRLTLSVFRQPGKVLEKSGLSNEPLPNFEPIQPFYHSTIITVRLHQETACSRQEITEKKKDQPTKTQSIPQPGNLLPSLEEDCQRRWRRSLPLEISGQCSHILGRYEPFEAGLSINTGGGALDSHAKIEWNLRRRTQTIARISRRLLERFQHLAEQVAKISGLEGVDSCLDRCPPCPTSPSAVSNKAQLCLKEHNGIDSFGNKHITFLPKIKLAGPNKTRKHKIRYGY